MNQGVVQSSPVQQMVAAAGSPTWWSTIRPPPPPHHHSFPNIAAASDTHLDHQLQDSWSQLLLGGLVGEAAGNFEARKMENWEQQFVNEMSTTSCGSVVDVKQESSCGGGYNYNNTSTPKPTIINSCNWSHHHHHHHHHQMVSASSSSPNSSSSITTTTTFTNNPHLDHLSPRSSSECNSTSTGGAAKKARTQPSSAHSTFKVRKEKLGDRVTALHQLVSPFGKTDTASVLLEAIGYIKFLETQIEALSQPYLGTGSSSSTPTLTQQHHPPLTEYCEEGRPKQDLKSRGLCLVPISCTLHVGSDNGADYWAPAFATAANFR